MLVNLTTGVLRKARKMSHMSGEDAAKACGLDLQTYYVRERYPDMFRISELASIYAAMSTAGREVLSSAIGELFTGD